MHSDIGISVRQVGDHEARLVYELKKAAFKEYIEQVWGWDEEEQWKLHLRRFAEQDFFLVSRASADVGYYSTTIECSCIKLHQMFIHPDCQSQGIGAWVIERLMKQAQESSAPIRLSVLKVNPRAKEFYLRAGFEPCGESETHDLLEWSLPVDNSP
ncbi:MAG: GNAT family N-acetyltransferase [Fimbriimonadaceae bacterium]|nr:GNAT family N-acetyltransferase [Fimbriimonadaceae bacterium]